MVALLIATGFTILSGCSDSDGAAASDAGVEGGPDLPRCYGAQTCYNGALHACAAGFTGAEIDACTGQTCSLGRCVPSLCAQAESHRTSFAGCLFYAFEADNVASDAGLATSLLVTNPGTTTAIVDFERPDVTGGNGATWVRKALFAVEPGSSERFVVHDLQVMNTGQFPGAAFRLSSTLPVTVALIESDDQDQEQTFSSAGTIVLPFQAIGSHYRVMTYPQVATIAVANTPGGLDGAGRVGIVGTQPGTGVTLTLSRTAVAYTSSAMTPVGPGETIHVTLGDGEVFQMYSGQEGADLSGTEILADAPVAVFSGNMTTTYGKTSSGVNSPDMAHEQMPPVGTWSRLYVAAALPPQSHTCDSLFGTPGASYWRILAQAQDVETRVSFGVPEGTTPIDDMQLAAGEVGDVVAVGSFTVMASAPVLVTQGIDCEPSLSLAVSADRFLDSLLFAVLPNFDQLITVVRQNGSSIALDGAPIADSVFQPAGGTFQVAQIELPFCPPSAQSCTHQLTGGFGMTLRGMDVVASYAMTAPTFAGCVDFSDPTCLQ